MKYLTIIRHAKSSWENRAVDDIARLLNPRGKEAILIIGSYLRKQKIFPDLLIASPAIRSRETAIGIAKFVKYDQKKLQVETAIYFGTSATIIGMLQQLNNSFNDVFLVGHEPTLSSLIFQLTKYKIEKFSTCSVFRISFNIKKWEEIERKNGICEFYVNPKQLTEK